jgi:hypothetical protein
MIGSRRLTLAAVAGSETGVDGLGQTLCDATYEAITSPLVGIVACEHAIRRLH